MYFRFERQEQLEVEHREDDGRIKRVVRREAFVPLSRRLRGSSRYHHQGVSLTSPVALMIQNSQVSRRVVSQNQTMCSGRP